MIARDEAALICDFAETYHIYDWRALKVQYAATLACGLPQEARIWRSMSGQAVPTSTLLMAAMVDRLSLLIWINSEDGYHGRNRPDSVVEAMLGSERADEVMGFASPALFEKERMKILKEVT